PADPSGTSQTLRRQGAGRRLAAIQLASRSWGERDTEHALISCHVKGLSAVTIILCPPASSRCRLRTCARAMSRTSIHGPPPTGDAGFVRPLCIAFDEVLRSAADSIAWISG
ncbi:unnamed protein product, partial [Mycena citricolor]